jgi:hypothetical protein
VFLFYKLDIYHMWGLFLLLVSEVFYLFSKLRSAQNRKRKKRNQVGSLSKSIRSQTQRKVPGAAKFFMRTRIGAKILGILLFVSFWVTGNSNLLYISLIPTTVIAFLSFVYYTVVIEIVSLPIYNTPILTYGRKFT